MYFIIFILKSNIAFAQRDSIASKHRESWLKDFMQDEPASPKKATLMSLALPGLGQVYNKKAWKVPIIYGGLGVSGYAIYQNSKNYRRFKTAYEARLAGTIDEFVGVLALSEIKNLKDVNRKYVEQSYFAFAIIYLLNGVDAFVDAHLKSFNVNEDLRSEHIQFPAQTETVTILRLNVPIGKK